MEPTHNSEEADRLDTTIETVAVESREPVVTDAPPRGRPKKKRSPTKTAIEWVVLIGSALLIALLIKTFLFQAFYIPSESMSPTLEKDDRVLVNKLSYRLHDVHRGDIVVFKAPEGADPSVKDLVKRVIGLPGDTVESRDDRVYINGQPLREPYLRANAITNCASFSTPCFPTGPIPEDHYWMMGDNRTASKDSRSFGLIEKDAIVGRVFIRIWPLSRLDLL